MLTGDRERECVCFNSSAAENSELRGVYVQEFARGTRGAVCWVLVKWRCYGESGKNGVATDATTNG